VRFPEQRTNVIVLANTEDLDASDLAFRLADQAIADHLDPSAPTHAETLEA
jgi:hypothetical protein